MMRRARISYPGSFHHVMSRGYQGNPIFCDATDKEFLLESWQRYAGRQEITILAWCILDNHYHLILHNPENTLSRFMRESNGRFGIHFRARHGGRGPVFDGRFRSTVIENPDYLAAAVIYLFQNPVRAGLAASAETYPWSSIGELCRHSPCSLTDPEAFSRWICDPESILTHVRDLQDAPREFSDPWGRSQGSQVHRFHSLHAGNRRDSEQNVENRRSRDRIRRTAGEAIQSFIREHGIQMNDLTARTYPASRLRRKLLLILRDGCGLRLGEIHKLEPFRHLVRNSLSTMYQVAIMEAKR